MPKRRMRTAAQIAASRRNLEKARAAKKLKGAWSTLIPSADNSRIPVGKTVLLVHRTTPEAAKSIVAQQKFKPRAWGYDKSPSKVWFTPASSKSGKRFYSQFGLGAVSVRVPRKVMKPDTIGSEHARYGAVTVDLKDLQGKKIRRHY